MTTFSNITRKTISSKILVHTFLNQFMLYLGLEEITRDDYYSLLLVFSHNPDLEFKHIIYLITKNEISTSKILKDTCSDKKWTWCHEITRDFDYVDPFISKP